MKSRIIGTATRASRQRQKGYRSDGMHNLRKAHRDTRRLPPMRIQDQDTARRTSRVTAGSRQAPDTSTNRIRECQPGAKHRHQHRSPGLLNGHRPAEHSPLLGKPDTQRQKPHATGDGQEGTDHRGRSQSDDRISPEPLGMVGSANMGARLCQRGQRDPCQRKSSCKTILRTATTDPMSVR